jgi:hypothetical protein
MIRSYTVLIIGCSALIPAFSSTHQGTITIEIPGQPIQYGRTIEDAITIAKAGRRNGVEQPIVITLPSGVIHLTKPIAFTDGNGGTAVSPLIIRGQSDGSTVISGATAIAHDAAAEISIDLARVAPNLIPDLTATSTEAGNPANRLLLFQGHSLLSLSSWPDKGYATDWKVLSNSITPRLTVDNAALPKGDNLVAAGYVSQDWQYQAIPAQSDGTSLTLRGAGKTGFQKIVRLKLLNVSGSPRLGRYSLNRNIVKVRGFGGQAPIEMAVAPSLFTFAGAHDVRIEAVALEKTSGTAVTISNSNSITLTDCFIGLTGAYAVDAANSRDIHVERCVVSQTGGGGVRLNGGNRTTLQPAHNWVRDSRIVDFGRSIRTYAPGVALTGVGNSVSDSFIGGAPHVGIVIAGNDHLIERNELSFLDCETNDASAIYMGRDWTQRGNHLTRNFIHDVGPGTIGAIVSGIYLDDQFSGAKIDHNVMLNIPHGIFIGGGRDNHLENNVFGAMSRSAVWVDDRGMNWQAKLAGPNGILRQTLEKSPYLTPLWRSRYSEMLNLLTDRPGYPVGNTAVNNTSFGAQLLWASPTTLKLAGSGNREMQISKEQQTALVSGIARRKYLAFRPANSNELIPGLRARLMFESRAPNATMCPTF